MIVAVAKLNGSSTLIWRQIIKKSRFGARNLVTPTKPLSKSDLPYHLVVGLPALSPTMSSGALAEWYVAEGDKFGAGDALAKIETDKASIDFEAQDDGFVAKLLKEAGTGADINVGTPIMITVEEEDDIGAFVNFSLQEEIKNVPVEAAVAVDPSPSVNAPVSASKTAEQVTSLVVPTPPSTSPSSSAAASAAATEIPEAAATSHPASLGQITVAWGSSASMTSPLASTLTLQQKSYIDSYGTTGQNPL